MITPYANTTYDLLIKIIVNSIPLIGLFCCYYLCILKPEKNALRDQISLIRSIRIGDLVETKSGIMGVVVEKNTNSLTIRSGPNTFLYIKQSHILKISDPQQ